MNIYECLNKITKYIDEHLEENISYERLARFLGVNTYTLIRTFYVLTDIPLKEYIRRRRLSDAALDLYNEQVTVKEVALKYQYKNESTFIKEFEKFHGIKPKKVTPDTRINIYPRLRFNEEEKVSIKLHYEIVDMKELTFYGICIEAMEKNIFMFSPTFSKQIEKQYGTIPYGMISYNEKKEDIDKYYCLFEEEIPHFEKIKIPASKWLRIRISSQEVEKIKEVRNEFYKEILFLAYYQLRDLPELIHFHDEVTDYLIAID